MKRLLIFLTILSCQFLIWGDSREMFVFMTPISHGKTNLIRDEVETLSYPNLGISNYYRWIQKIHNQDFLIHFIKGKRAQKFFQIIQEKIEENDPIAIKLNEIYFDALHIDLKEGSFLPDLYELTEVLDMGIEQEEESLIKEYCFIYPILPHKKEKILKMYQDVAEYHDEQIQDIYRYRGISKIRFWIQETDGQSFLVVYQEIIGPVNEARKKFLSSKNEELSHAKTKEFVDVTGLSYEELLPQLESLFDSEILN